LRNEIPLSLKLAPPPLLLLLYDRVSYKEEEEKKEEMLISEDTCLKTGKHGPATAQIDKTLESEPKIINLLHLRMLLLGGAFPLT